MENVHRIGFTLRVRKERIEEYVRRHQEVWPEMLSALTAAGWHNYSLFLREDGLLFGYVEVVDFDAALAAMAKTEVNARWQKEMAPFFESEPGLLPDEHMKPLSHIFYLP
ncbi:MAG TPA: L-rhamnose mutarotase [Capsulimonadaceae bacterium]|nr:L-rhamnose mutarotase [Capsulimonadaceae bacterium]